MYYILTLLVGIWAGYLIAIKTYEDAIKEQQVKRNQLLKIIMPISPNPLMPLGQLERDTQLWLDKASSSLGSSWYKDKTDPTKTNDEA